MFLQFMSYKDCLFTPVPFIIPLRKTQNNHGKIWGIVKDLKFTVLTLTNYLGFLILIFYYRKEF
jgi:hypothetical protein